MQERDYTLMLSELRKADVKTAQELFARFSALTIAYLYLTWWLQDNLILLAYLVYAVLQYFYIRALSRQADAGSRITYRRFLATALICTVIYDFIIIYVWTTGDPIGQFSAILLLIGHLIYCVARQHVLRDLVIIEGIAICGTSIFIALSFGFRLQTNSSLWGLVLACALIAVYFVGTLIDIYIAQQKKLAAQAKREREERLRTIGQMTAGVAHDFNNIMTAALGHLELFSYTDDPIEQRAHVSAARQSADRAVDLTQQLMAYSRKAPIERALRDLVPLIEEVVRDHTTVFGASLNEGLELSLTPDLQTLAPFWVDGSRMQSAVANLLRNGTEALGPDGALQLSVALEEMHEDWLLPFGDVLPKGVYVAISVTDNGAGIAAKDLERVTEPFWSTKGHANGSGLGLAMVQGFAEQSGGRLEINSKPGKGTVATLRLPYTTDPYLTAAI